MAPRAVLLWPFLEDCEELYVVLGKLTKVADTMIFRVRKLEGQNMIGPEIALKVAINRPDQLQNEARIMKELASQQSQTGPSSRILKMLADRSNPAGGGFGDKQATFWELGNVRGTLRALADACAEDGVAIPAAMGARIAVDVLAALRSILVQAEPAAVSHDNVGLATVFVQIDDALFDGGDSSISPRFVLGNFNHAGLVWEPRGSKAREAAIRYNCTGLYNILRDLFEEFPASRSDVERDLWRRVLGRAYELLEKKMVDNAAPSADKYRPVQFRSAATAYLETAIDSMQDFEKEGQGPLVEDAGGRQDLERFLAVLRRVWRENSGATMTYASKEEAKQRAFTDFGLPSSPIPIVRWLDGDKVLERRKKK